MLCGLIGALASAAFSSPGIMVLFYCSLVVLFVLLIFKELMQNRFVEIPALHQSGLYPRHGVRDEKR